MNDKNQEIQRKMDAIREKKGLDKVDLSQPDPFKITKRGKLDPKPDQQQ
jgi:hypothetical protein